MQIYFHRRLCSYLSRVPILVEGTIYSIYIYIYIYIYILSAVIKPFSTLIIMINVS